MPDNGGAPVNLSDFAKQYCERIAAIRTSKLTLEAAKRDELRLFGDERLEIYYAPFDYINTDAAIAIVGVTPGPTQLLESYQVIRDHYAGGASFESALTAVKARASFKGMRKDLGRWLDELGVAERLGVPSSSVLFDDPYRHLLHTTSAIRYPTFVQKRNGTAVNYAGRSPVEWTLFR